LRDIALGRKGVAAPSGRSASRDTSVSSKHDLSFEVVTPNVGVPYSANPTMIGDHGGFARDDTNVILLLAYPTFKAQTVSGTTTTSHSILTDGKGGAAPKDRPPTSGVWLSRCPTPNLEDLCIVVAYLAELCAMLNFRGIG
jgi:hypothetical protein